MRKTIPLLVFAIAGCDSPTAPSEWPSPQGFTFAVSGDVQGTHYGRGIVMPVAPAGFVGINPQTGARTEFAVTPIFLPDVSSIAAPSLHIGILGEARVGTYSVYGGGTQLQYYADFSVLRENFLRRRFEITGGTLTLTRVTTRFIEGSFTFESRIYYDWPRDPPAGTNAVGVPTSLNITGRFVTPWSGAPY